MGMVSEVSMWVWRKRRNRRDDVVAVSERASAGTPVIRAAVSGLYVDMENLQGQDFAQRFLANLVQNWPSDVPPLGVVRLYVRADTQVLWEMWMESQFADVGVSVRGIQHFSKNASKNSADIALALDAVCDLMTDSVQHIVVVSDDSDFAALFGKVRELGRQAHSDETPFLWIMTNREQTRSKVIGAFLPNVYIRSMDVETDEAAIADGVGDTRLSSTDLAQPVLKDSANGVPTSDEIAKAIIQDIRQGSFNSTDCQPIISGRWPGCEWEYMDGPQFGQRFITDILPTLKRYGVSDPYPNTKPRRYVMTRNAKIEMLRQQSASG